MCPCVFEAALEAVFFVPRRWRLVDILVSNTYISLSFFADVLDEETNLWYGGSKVGNVTYRDFIYSLEASLNV